MIGAVVSPDVTGLLAAARNPRTGGLVVIAKANPVTSGWSRDSQPIDRGEACT
jgi:hypothetical protein